MNPKFTKGTFVLIFLTTAGLFFIVMGIITFVVPLNKEPARFLYSSLVFPVSGSTPTWEETKRLLSIPLFRLIMGGIKLIAGVYFCKIGLVLFKKLNQ